MTAEKNIKIISAFSANSAVKIKLAAISVSIATAALSLLTPIRNNASNGVNWLNC
jgi:hypothetical protein